MIRASVVVLTLLAATGCSTENDDRAGDRGSVAPTRSGGQPSDRSGSPTGRECPDFVQPGPVLDRSGSSIDGETFTGAPSYSCMFFIGAAVTGTEFGNFDTHAYFADAVLTEVTFRGTGLAGADFTGTTLRRVRFVDANLRSAYFARNTLTDVEFVRVICPSGIRSTDNGGDCKGHGIEE